MKFSELPRNILAQRNHYTLEHPTYFSQKRGLLSTKIDGEASMATIVSQSELVRKAAEYITQQRADNPQKDIHTLLDEAGMRFNLTPLDQASLERIFSNE